MDNKPKPLHGFTLIELLIVIVIIGALAGVMFSLVNPQLSQDRARDGVRIANLQKAADAIDTHFSMEGAYPVDQSAVLGSPYLLNWPDGEPLPDDLYYYSYDHESESYNVCVNSTSEECLIYNSNIKQIVRCTGQCETASYSDCVGISSGLAVDYSSFLPGDPSPPPSPPPPDNGDNGDDPPPTLPGDGDNGDNGDDFSEECKEPGDFPSDLRSCALDSDCVLVKEQCGCACSPCVGGEVDFESSINKKYLQDWNEALDCRCGSDHDEYCPPTLCCTAASAVCINNTCSYTLYNNGGCSITTCLEGLPCCSGYVCDINGNCIEEPPGYVLPPPGETM